METITQSARETQKLGETIGNSLKPGALATVLLLHGDLGSGKTTFVQGLAKGLGVSERIVSPTFILMRHYELSNQLFTTLYHIDLYRLDEANSLESLGLEELFQDPHALIVIEWPQRLGKVKPEGATMMNFSVVSENKRRITIPDN